MAVLGKIRERSFFLILVIGMALFAFVISRDLNKDMKLISLHFDDIKVLLEMINKLADKGNTIIIIEHNMDVIKTVDHIIEIGPQGGRNGGEIIFSGSPEKLINIKKSPTAKYLKKELT